MKVRPQTQIEQRIRAFAETCRQKGLKVTHQRTEIFRELAASPEHPDAQTVYRNVRRRIASISRDTVYRTLATFEEHGLLRRVGVLHGAARFDGDTTPHHHFICTACGAIQDFRNTPLDDLPVPRSARRLGKVRCTLVQLHGTCNACLARRE